jgi:hypothetical protein
MDDQYHLAVGPHRRPGGARCAMEWVAHLAGQAHTDSPATVSPVLAAFARSWNDALPDDVRQRLRPYLARTIGTAADGHDERRAWLCTDWLVRTCVPAMLDQAGLRDHADALRRLDSLDAEGPLRAARGAAGRARAAARAAAALPVAISGARHAATTVPRATGWEAARAAVRSAPPCQARETAAEIACQTARDAAWAAAWRDAPAAWSEMRPVALELQASAFDLLDRMLPSEVLADPREAALHR